MKTKLQLLFNSLLLLIVLVCSDRMYSQINYTQSFAGSSDWDGFNFTDEDACDANGSIRYNIWLFDYYAQTISPSIGISNGMPVTLTYSYKVINYDGGDAASADWGFLEVYYGTSDTGTPPFTLVQTVDSSNHTPSTTCVTKTVTFTPAAGQPVYLAFYTEQLDEDADVYVYIDNITAVQAASTGCTGEPAANTAVAAKATVCNQEQVSLSLTPFATASGLTYQWQSSTDNVTYTNIAGATATTYSALQAGTRWYRAITTCTASTLSTTSAAVQVTSSGLNCLCNVTFPSGVEAMTNVTFGTINNTTSPSSNLQNESFPTPQPIVIKGLSYPISLQGNTAGNYTNYFKVFIDFNQNGNLDEDGESFEIGSIVGSTGTDGQAATGTITIPPGALTGVTNMRVIKKFSSYPESACNSSGFGQAEDYLINIQPCTTVAPTADATQTFCQGATLTDLAVTGTGVKWYAVATDGNALPTASVLVSTTYYASQTSGGCEGPRTPVVVTINTPLADDPADVLSCEPYALPALTNGTYHTAVDGGGSVVLAGTVIQETTTLYVYAETATTPVCSVDNAFTVTITDGVVADNPDDVSACGSYTLPELSANNVYRTATGGAGTVVEAGTEVTETTTLYVYASTTSTPVCSDENSFTVTIFNTVADDPADVVSCGEYTLPALTNGTYHTAANGGGETLAAGDVVEESTTLYVFAQAAGLETCTADNAFTVTVNYVEVDELDDVTACGEYILPEIENGTYYSGASGLGTMYEAGDAITETSTIHIFAQEGTGTTACSAESMFTVTILNATPLEREDVTACKEYILPDLPSGSVYFSGPNGQGESYPPGQPISASTTVYIQTATNGAIVCSAESSFEVTIINVEALEDKTFTVVLAENGDVTTLADYDLEAEGDVVYYPNEQAAIDQTPVLSEETEIPMGTTTYYVRVLQNGCYSEPSTVTFTVTLGTDSFDAASFSYYPNPVTDVLNVSYSQNINQISVYNLVGQLVLVKNVNNTSTQVDLGELASGTYMVKVQTDNASKVVKVIKNR